MRKLIWIICALALPGAAFAEDVSTPTRCETQAKSMCAPVSSARLTSANGAVLLSRGTGFAEVKSGASLVAGDRLLVKQGSADVAFGPSCRTPLGPNSMVTLVEKDGVLCAAQLSSDPNVVAADLPSRRAPPPPHAATGARARLQPRLASGPGGDRRGYSGLGAAERR